MLKWYWVVAVLVGVLWFKNTRYALKQYLANRQKMIFTIYMAFLLILGFLIVHVTSRVMSLVQASQDVIDAP